MDEEFGDLVEKQWVKVFSRPHNIQRIGFLWPAFLTGLPQDKSLRMTALLILPGDKKYDYYLYENEWTLFLEKLAKHMLTKSPQMQEQELDKISNPFIKEAKKVSSTDLIKWDNKKLLTWFKQYSSAYANFSFCVWTPWAIDSVLAPKLKEELEKLNPKKAYDWFEIISTQTRFDNITQQQIDLLKIAVKKDFAKLKQHTQKYFWLPVYNIGDQPWTIEDFKKQLSQIKNPEKELKQKQQEIKEKEEKYAKTLQEINQLSKLKSLIETVHLYTFLRNERVDRWRKGIHHIAPFYREIARRAKITLNAAVNLFDEEIITFLEKQTLPDSMAERKTQHAILYRDGIRKIFTEPEEIENLRKQELGDVKQQITEVKGMPAYKGIVKGSVRLIRTPKDLENLKQGEILVAHHTSPEFVLAMKRVAAIVTDEGGITSHAAIVSRELKIPCVTATKEGSNVFKTGDLVEVDADKGIVRKLK